MGAVIYDIVADQGGTVELPILVTEDGESVDLTGYTGQMQVRSSYADDATLLVAGTVTIDAGAGLVTGTILGADTEDATWRSGVYDLRIINGSDPDDIEYVARGSIRLRPTVTRS